MARKKKEIIPIGIEQFPIQTRAINILKDAGYKTDQDFKGAPEKDVKDLEGFGPTMLAELKLFLKGVGVKFQPVPKKAKKPGNPQIRDLILILLANRKFAFGQELLPAKLLLDKYDFQLLVRVKLPDHVDSLRWLASGIGGGWADEFINGFAPMKMVEKTPAPIQEKRVEEVKKVEYRPAAKPMDLQTFLGLKK